jgi:hypothetical protein
MSKIICPHLSAVWRGSMLEQTGKTPKGKAERRDKFVELAQSRTVNAIKAIRVIAKLGNKSHYEYSEADVKKIAAALTREVDALKARMLQSGSKDTVDFTL